MANSRYMLMLAVLWGAAGARGLAGERYVDFRGQPLPFDMKPFGPEADLFVKPAADGLHMTLPEDRKDRKAVGVSFPVNLPDDFEVTARVIILRADAPKAGHGVGVLLGVKHSVRVGRLVRPEGQQVVLWDRNVGAGTGTPKLEEEAFPCQAQEICLRLKRQKAVLHFLWAPGVVGDEFKEIHQCEFAGEVRIVKLITQTGQQACGLDVRLLDLRIASGGEAATASLPQTDATADSGRLLLWLASAVAVVLLTAVALALSRRIRVTRSAPGAATAAAGQTPAADAVSVVQCPSCGKSLTVSSHLLGKKVKCPGCAASFVN